MADDERAADPSWLLEPPDAGAVHLELSIGPGVELSSDARAALETLVTALLESEVTGFANDCGSLDACGTYHCYLGKCILFKSPCLADIWCKIAELR